MTQPIQWTIPGFMNEHAHLDKGMLVPERSYKDDPVAIRAGWTREAKSSFTKQDIYSRAEQALQQLLSYGTAYVRTHVDVDPLVGLQGIEALLELREHYKNDIIIDITAFNQEGFDRYPDSAGLLTEALTMDSRIGIGGHTLSDQDGCSHINRIFELAEQANAPWVEFHTDESGKPEHFLLPYLAEQVKARGWSGKTYAIHCNSLANVSDELAEQAIALTAEAGLHVTVCPTAIATRAITRVKQLNQAGVRIGMGSDNMSDFFNPMGSGNMLQYAQLLAYIQRFYEPREMDMLLRIISQMPFNAESAVLVSQLAQDRYRFTTKDSRYLLTHLPLPS
ncbi:amidohydrolase family protein [Paenibacillus sp. 2TAB19]|uniref:amidohydrolase family protein n=1 Tax=Paenibacillus sp. 2TAB19 TaxID=3233003 RepID=UPI003F971CB1